VYSTIILNSQFKQHVVSYLQNMFLLRGLQVN